MERAAVERWIDGYRRAWGSDSPDEIAALFTEDAVYKPFPWPREAIGWRGRDEIVARWIERGDSSNEWRFDHEVIAVDGDTAVIEGWTRYTAVDGKPEDISYANLWVVRYTANGRARQFVEWWIERPRDEPTIPES